MRGGRQEALYNDDEDGKFLTGILHAELKKRTHTYTPLHIHTLTRMHTYNPLHIHTHTHARTRIHA